MLRFLINIIFILTFFQTVGQDRNAAGGGQSYSYDNIYSTRSYDKEEKYLGTTYLFSDWNNKGIFFITGKSYIINSININVLRNDIEALMGKDSIIVFDKYKIDSLIINNKKFKKYKSDSFYEVLYEGENKSLLKNYNIDTVEGTFNISKGAYDKTRYKITNRYFIKEGDDILIFNLDKKSVLGNLKENEEAVKRFVKKKKLSYKKEADLIEIFKFYDEI